MYHVHVLIVFVLNRPFVPLCSPFFIIFCFPGVLDVVIIFLDLFIDLFSHWHFQAIIIEGLAELRHRLITCKYHQPCLKTNL